MGGGGHRKEENEGQWWRDIGCVGGTRQTHLGVNPYSTDGTDLKIVTWQGTETRQQTEKTENRVWATLLENKSGAHEYSTIDLLHQWLSHGEEDEYRRASNLWAAETGRVVKLLQKLKTKNLLTGFYTSKWFCFLLFCFLWNLGSGFLVCLCSTQHTNVPELVFCFVFLFQQITWILLYIYPVE